MGECMPQRYIGKDTVSVYKTTTLRNAYKCGQNLEGKTRVKTPVLE